MGLYPSQVYVATVAGGIFYTSSFSLPTSSAQPVWQAVNTGLPDDGAGGYNVVRFWLDPHDPTYQYCHIIQGGWEDLDYINSLYRRSESTATWVEILSLDNAIAYASLDPPVNFEPVMRLGVDDTTPGRLFVAIRSALSGKTFGAQHLLVSANRGGAGGVGDWAGVGAEFGSPKNGSSYPFLVTGDTLTARSGASTSNPTYQSTNGGLTWLQITPGNSGAIRGAYADHSVVYVSLTTGSFEDLAEADPSGNLIVEVPPDAIELVGHSTNTGGFGGMWISRTNPAFQWVLRRRDGIDAVQELWETTDAWGVTATKIADLAVVSSGPAVYRPALRRVSNNPSIGLAILGFRTTTQPPQTDQPHSVFAWDAYSGAQPAGKAGSDPENPASMASIPYTSLGAIDDGVWYLYESSPFITRIH